MIPRSKEKIIYRREFSHNPNNLSNFRFAQQPPI